MEKFNFSNQIKEQVNNIKKINKEEIEINPEKGNKENKENKESADLNINKNEIINNNNKNISIESNNNILSNNNNSNNLNNEENKIEKDNKHNEINELNEDNAHNCHSDLEPEEMYNEQKTFIEIKKPKKEENKLEQRIVQNINDENKKQELNDNLFNEFDKEKEKLKSKMEMVNELKQRKLNLNLVKKEEGKNNESNNSNYSSSNPNLLDNKLISKSYNIITNSPKDNIKEKRNIFKNKKDNMSDSYNSEIEIGQKLYNNNSERNRNINIKLDNNFNKINHIENEDHKRIIYNISYNMEINEKINMNNNIKGNKFPINQTKKEILLLMMILIISEIQIKLLIIMNSKEI